MIIIIIKRKSTYAVSIDGEITYNIFTDCKYPQGHSSRSIELDLVSLGSGAPLVLLLGYLKQIPIVLVAVQRWCVRQKDRDRSASDPLLVETQEGSDCLSAGWSTAADVSTCCRKPLADMKETPTPPGWTGNASKILQESCPLPTHKPASTCLISITRTYPRVS